MAADKSKTFDSSHTHRNGRCVPSAQKSACPELVATCGSALERNKVGEHNTGVGAAQGTPTAVKAHEQGVHGYGLTVLLLQQRHR
jgi:hypothetical protein